MKSQTPVVERFGRRQTIGFGLWLVTLAVATPSLAQRYVGEERCATCHPAQAALHRLTAHAQALHRPAEHPLVGQFAVAPPATRPPSFQFSLSRKADGIYLSARGDGDALDIKLDWAFGAGGQGVTFVSRGNAAWYLEHAMSFFPPSGKLDLTPGHDRRPKTLTEAVGILYSVQDRQNGIAPCFECHSSGPVVITAEGVRVSEQGVQCESCHGPGGDHVTALALRETAAARATILNPARLSALELSRMCGQCHRPPGAGQGADSATLDWDDAWNVRHAPPYLLRSACFADGSGALSCSSCHPAHQPLRRDDGAFYSSRCRECHPAVEHSEPVANDGCTSCHMPQVQPHRRLRFTNHWIGVYADDRPLKPLGSKP